MCKLLLAAALALPIATVAAASPAISAQAIEGPATLELRAGLNLPVPQGWRGAASADGITASLVGPDGESTIIATITQAAPDAIEGELAASIDLGGGLVLTPVTEVGQAQGHYYADYAVSGASQPAEGIVLAQPLPGDRALALIAIVPLGTLEQMRPLLNHMLESSNFVEPPPQVASAPSGAADDWSTYLRGRYLVNIYNGNGYFEKHDLWFCSDGTFGSADEGGGFTTGVASGAFGSNGGGTWSATGKISELGIISFAHGDGTRGELQVEMGADGVYLNGERWLRGDNDRCQ